MKKSLKIYNTLSGQKEIFTPQDAAHIKMYVCGPTVYAPPHIGNARSAVVFDLVHRFLKNLYPQVSFVRNITDIDDKIITAMQETGETLESITDKYAKVYSAAMDELFVLTPTHQPKATHYIDHMISMIRHLIDSGFAYAQDGHVLFQVAKHESYGELSKQNLEGVIAGARVEVAPYKKDAADFVLWKPSTEGVPGWQSPWGYGRPGWHIECSAMIDNLLGETLDIHGGGQDLTFPHHENELAQSKCSHAQKPLANYWMHNGMLHMGGEKMSKSLGNIQTVDELLKLYPGEVIRYALLSGHYRQSLEWNEDLLNQSYESINRFYQALKNVESIEAEQVDFNDLPLEALYDDFNTPQYFALLHEICTKLNKAKTEKNKSLYKGLLLGLGQFSGFLYQNPKTWLQNGSNQLSLTEDEIERFIVMRKEARASKNFSEADRIRDHLLEQGIQLEDNSKGTFWRRS
jgi:cysteinyl-tRNA synthetase